MQRNAPQMINHAHSDMPLVSDSLLDWLTFRRHTQRPAYVMTADVCRRHNEWLAAMPSNGSMPC
jgi:hypothetical protein